MKHFKNLPLKMADSEWDRVLKSLVNSYKNKIKEIKNRNFLDFCFQNEKIREIVENYTENVTSYCKSRCKNNVISIEKRNEGNRKYKEKNYSESLQLYTESIFFASEKDESLCLAYANRSLILYLLGYYSECLQDIQLALDAGYPEVKKINLIIRKSKCFVKLGDVEKAQEILNNALREPHLKNWFALIQNHVKEFKSITTKGKPKKLESGLPQLAGGENENFSFSSKYLTVNYNELKERHVIATHDIEVGDILFVEKPFAFVVFKDYCHNCCKKIVAPVPCEYCLDASYCSIECRKEFWKSVHSYECGFSKLFETIGIAHLSLRIILAASSSFSNFKNITDKLTKNKYESGSISWNSNAYNKIYNLVSNVEKFELTDLFQYAVTALLLGIFLKNYTNYFSHLSNDEDLKTVAQALWLHILQLICNGHSITYTYGENSIKNEVVEVKEDRVGTAIYSSASMMNHSCEPSVINSFYKNYLIIKALKPIKKGEEVYNCYGPHARRMIRSKRQEILSQQYFFKCECEACTGPVDIQEKYAAFKCNQCKGPLIRKEKNLLNYVCLDCGNFSQIDDDILEKNNLIYFLLEEGKSLLATHPEAALRKLLKSWLLGREIFYKFNKTLSITADEVAKCLASLKDFRRSLMFLNCSLFSVEERFGSSSIELAHELRKFGDLITNYCVQYKGHDVSKIEAAKGLEAYKKSQKIMNLIYGPDSEGINDIQEHLNILQAFLNS